MVNFSILVFPGSNCDTDCRDVLANVLGQNTNMVWHKETSLPKTDVVVVPGGFSYGDYLRCGAMAKFSPIMKEVVKFAKAGGKVLGICNGFQILTEAGLLPGTLIRNEGLQFICKPVELKLVNAATPFTKKGIKGNKYTMPIAHGEGNFFIDPNGLKSLQDNNQIVFQYADNPNGSLLDIAGICNLAGNVLGMMPHPERASEDLLGGQGGKFIFESLLL